MDKLLTCLIVFLATHIAVNTQAFAASRLPPGQSSLSKNDKLTNEPLGIINFDKTLIDFGTVKRGQKLPAKFTFKNIGKGPLAIQGVQAPCDCTTVESAKGQTVAPGESGALEVIFDTTDYSGKVTKALTVITNERSMPDRTLTVSAIVNSDVDAMPPLADFGEVVLNQTAQQIIRLKNNMKTDLKIERIRYNEEFLDVGFTKEGHEFVIYIKLKPNTPIGFFKDTIWLKNNSSALPEMPIPVRATVRGQISANPAYLEFGSVPSNQKSSRQLKLASIKDFDITSNQVEMNINGVKADDGSSLIQINVLPDENNGKKISMELKNPGNRSGSVHGKITLQTTIPQQKILSVDFYAFFR